MKKGTSKTTNRTSASAARAKAEAIAARYRIVVQSRDGVGFGGWSVEMPLVFGRGKTEAECVADTRKSIVLAIQTLLEKGETPPAPASENKREVQLNIRLTPEERSRIEERARQAGFRSVSDYIRRAALRGVA